MPSKETFMPGQDGRRNAEAGVALLSAILVLMLLSALLVGFISSVNSDQQASGINRDQTQAYAAAHAGVEKLTADLGQLFENNFAPTNAEVDALAVDANKPTIDGIDYLSPNGTSGYRITYTDTRGPNGQPPADGSPDLKRWDGWPISSGQYEGLTGLITPYNIEVTARTSGGAEVRMRREIQTVGIPVFQFGIFSENDLSFFAGPNFAFGGRVHTNQHLFLKQDGTATLTLQDRVSAVGEIVRQVLANGESSHFGNVRVALAAGCPAAPAAATAACRNLAQDEGSVVDGPTSAVNEPTWTNLSTGTYNGWIRNGRTGARRLDLPLVRDGARPVDLIRRPPVGEATTTNIGRQRFYNMATLRILVSDSRADLTGLPGVVTTPDVSPVPLSGAFTPTAAEAAMNGAISQQAHSYAASDDGATYTQLLQNGFRTTAGTSSIGGYILINRQDRNGNWTDVTREILSLGFTGKRLSNGNFWQINPDNNCTAPHPNAVIRVQRYRDSADAAACGGGVITGNNTGVNYWPNILYDAREGMLRDDENARPVVPALDPAWGVVNHATNDPRLYWGGVMHYVELDVNNLRRWLDGSIGTTNAAGCYNGGNAGTGTCAMDVTGYVVYFSDRRGNRDFGEDNAADAPTVTVLGAAPFGTEVTYTNDDETGELGMEDIINTASTSAPNNQLDHQFTDAGGNVHFSEDLNWELPTVPAANAPGRGTLQTYGNRARLLPRTANAGESAPVNRQLWVTGNGYTPQGDPDNANLYRLYANPIDRNVARVNRAFFFRRALKLVNGGGNNLPRNGSQGLTVAAENPVYIEGNYNACPTNQVPSQANNFQPACTGGVTFGNTPGVDHVSASVIADAVTLLSNAWNDIRSFNTPHTPAGAAAPYTANNARPGVTTWFRTAVIAGKGYNFPRAATNPQGVDHTDWGTDGGAHNFLRFLEGWNGTLNYRGSILSFYTNRQAVGIYKCCSIVYGAPTRGYNFDTEFLTPALLPPRTPMFRTLNTLTFRQVLRPTQ